MNHYHFIGIGGIGMSALARILLKQGFKVSGSDASDSLIIDELKNEGAEITLGHHAKNVQKGCCIVYNTMIKEDNPELEEAKNLGLPFIHRSDVLKVIGESYKTLAVTGTHGKTTTSSLLATVLKEGGLDPSYALGGILLGSKSNGSYGRGQYFVVEADESDASFLRYPVYGAIVTNIDGDHLDHYGSIEALEEAFSHFLKGVQNKELLFWCKDDAKLLKIADEGISYGFRSHSQLMGYHLRQESWKSIFDVRFQGKEYLNVEVGLAGAHMALNALAVFGLALKLGVSEESVRTSLKNFAGIARRCERKSNHPNILILDDYAHHPTEIKTTLQGIRKAIQNKNLIAVFQPHRYSRTKLCLEDYKDAFEVANEIIVTDIYGAFETPVEGLNANVVVSKIKEHTSLPCSYIPKAELKERLVAKIRPHDVVVTLNAGDLTKISAEIGAHFSL